MSLSVRGVVGASVGAFGALNGYWGQKTNQDLRTYCDSGVSSVTLGFINSAPEHDKSDLKYPGINFSSHCWAETYTDKNGVPSPLYEYCQSLKTDIPYCQDKGVKVILSIGGMYSDDGNNYKVSTTANGVQFADKVYQIFGPYNPTAGVARPFDSPDRHVAVDGFDFDLEVKLDNKPYIAMINRLRALDKSLIITGAPQCPLSTTPNDMAEMLQQASFDALFIQFYNNPVCDYVADGNGDKFNLDEWVSFMAKSNSKSAKLYVGLPGGPTSNSAGSGYITPDQVKELVCKYSTKTPNWGGISIWDLDTAAANVVNGKNFNQHVADALKYGCGPVPTTTSTTVSSTKTSSSSTKTSTSSSTTTTKASSTTVSSTTKASSTTSSSTSSSSSSSTSVSSTSKASSTTASSTSKASSTTVSSSTTPSSTASSTSVSSTSKASSTTVSSSTTPSSTISSTSVSSTSKASSTVSSTSVASSTTVSSATESSSSSTKESSSSSTKGTSSTAKPTSATTTDVTTSPPVPTSTPVTSIVSSTTKWSNSTITSSTVSMTTSTVYTTSVHTVTKCPPYVTNCPHGGYVTTETIPLYTTVCPVTETPKPPKPTQTKTSAAWTTSTVYTTKIHTVTACPPQVTNCPVGHVTTETIPWYTTVCPVTETETGKVPQPTPSVPGGVNPPPVESTSSTSATSTITKTVTVPGTQPTGVTPKPSCSGPGCPGVSSGVAVPTLSWTTTPVAPSQGFTSTPGGPSAVPTNPVQAGASTLALGLSGLVAMVAFQVFAL
ncbi:chitinase 18-18 [Purpureocillium lavendulum]|uniref:chitinase n=1 Tax=Purpureocillium lavendulum TaxID=1247861 RepID=A0AB34G5V4_9HYPO|nr:chitinase 18-18 [Purpureocillium lavendulum]